jgi:hypothetical protein
MSVQTSQRHFLETAEIPEAVADGEIHCVIQTLRPENLDARPGLG